MCISHILGVGKPVDLRHANNRAVRINPELVASAEDAGASYEALGGRLTRFPSFGFLTHFFTMVDLFAPESNNLWKG